MTDIEQAWANHMKEKHGAKPSKGTLSNVASARVGYEHAIEYRDRALADAQRYAQDFGENDPLTQDALKYAARWSGAAWAFSLLK